MLGAVHGLSRSAAGQDRHKGRRSRSLLDASYNSIVRKQHNFPALAQEQCVCACFWRPGATQQLQSRGISASAAPDLHSPSPSSVVPSAANNLASTELPREPTPADLSSRPVAADSTNAATLPPSTQSSALPATAADAEAARRGLASMAQLASAWAQVSSRLAPDTPLEPSDAVVAAAAASVYQSASTSADVAAARSAPLSPESLPPPAPPQSQLPSSPGQLATSPSAAPWRQHHEALHQHSFPQQHQQREPQESQQSQHDQQEHKKQQQQQQHFEAIIIALKLALASLQPARPRRDGRSPATRAVQLASTLADLCAAGLPLDAAAMCAGVVAEAADMGALRHDVIRAQLGPSVAALVHDMLRVRQAPRRIELLDDEGASAVREWCLAFHDVRACVVEVVSWWDELQHMGGLPLFEQQALALEALQIGAPLGHALGLGPLSAMMEDMCLKVLFPDSYASTSAWLRGLMDPAEDALFAAQQRLLAALDAHPGFGRLAGGLVVKARTKSLFSVMKKLLHLGDLARGGRTREELYDLLGMRAIVKPPDYLPPDEAEAAATKACYIVQDVASTLWRPVPTRSKDYIVAPKANGYQSIHLTLQLGQLDMAYDTYGAAPAPPVSSTSSTSSSSYDGGAAAATELFFGDRARPGLDPSKPQGQPGAGAGGSQPSSATAAAEGALRGAADAACNASVDGNMLAAAEAAVGGPLCLELQIRTVAMDRAAETGDAAHAVYKGGLDAHTARQLQAWTQELRTRLAAQPRGRLLLRSASTGKLSPEEAQAAAERRRRRRERRAAAAAAAAATAAAVAAAAAAVVAGGAPTDVAPGTAAAGGPTDTSTSASRGATADASAAPSLTPARGAAGDVAESPSSPPLVRPTPQGATVSASGDRSGPASLSSPGGGSLAAAGPAGGADSNAAMTSGTTAQRTAMAPSGTSLPPPPPSLPAKAPPLNLPVSASASASAVAGLELMPPPRRSSGAAHAAAEAQPRTGIVSSAAEGTSGPAAVPTAGPGPAGASVSAPPPSTRLQVCKPGDDQHQRQGQHAGPRTGVGGASSGVRGPDQLRGDASLPPGCAAAVAVSATAPNPTSGNQPYGARQTARASQHGQPHAATLPAERPEQMQQQQHQERQAQWTGAQQQQQQQQGQQQHEEVEEEEQQQESSGLQQQQQQQQQLMLFNSIASIDDAEEAMVIGLQHHDAAAAAEQLFRHLDVNGDGRLSLGEVRQVLLDLAAPATDRDARALMSALDRNGDGGVSLEEFVESVSLAQLQQEQEQGQEQEQLRERRRGAEQRALEAAARQQQLPQQQPQGQSNWQPWQHRM